MSNSELLTAISDIMEQKLEEKLDKKLDEKLDKKLDEKLNPVILRLDRLEEDLVPRVKNLEESLEGNLIPRFKNFEESLKGNLIPRVKNLEESLEGNLIPRVKNLEINMENELIPRLSHIEECYLDTFERYREGVSQLDDMQRDITVIKLTITNHSEKLNKITGPYLIK